jgi:hypothetical protein
MFDMNADPDSIASRAAELALEQHDRLRDYLRYHPNDGAEFYRNGFECGISNNIARLMCAYAVLKGHVTPEQAGVKL